MGDPFLPVRTHSLEVVQPTKEGALKRHRSGASAAPFSLVGACFRGSRDTVPVRFATKISQFQPPTVS